MCDLGREKRSGHLFAGVPLVPDCVESGGTGAVLPVGASRGWWGSSASGLVGLGRGTGRFGSVFGFERGAVGFPSGFTKV
jgi:hypothetical protein